MSQVNKRASVRFEPDPGSYVMIDADHAEPGSFQPKITGLMFNESYTGCAVFILSDQKLPKDVTCLVRPAQLQNPLKAVVRWREDFDIGVSKVGFQYLES